jgi:hypothetical protein
MSRLKKNLNECEYDVSITCLVHTACLVLLGQLQWAEYATRLENEINALIICIKDLMVGQGGLRQQNIQLHLVLTSFGYVKWMVPMVNTESTGTSGSATTVHLYAT